MRLLCLIPLSVFVLSGQARLFSPDKGLYAIEEQGRKIGQGEERERVSIFASDGTPVSVLHIWLTEPDGTMRQYTRGCESAGWIDSIRFFCEGSINPSQGSYRWFDAKSGRELGEVVGDSFTWSPGKRVLAHFGNVPHFTDVASKTDSLQVGAHEWPSDSRPDREQHWFRSDLAWSPDSKYVAVVNHRRRKNKGFFLEVVEGNTGARTEHKLQWRDEADEWHPDHDFTIEWTKTKLMIHHAGAAQSLPHYLPQ